MEQTQLETRATLKSRDNARSFQKRRVKDFLNQLSQSRINQIQKQRTSSHPSQNQVLRRSSQNKCRTPIRFELVNENENKEEENHKYLLQLEDIYFLLRQLLRHCQLSQWEQGFRVWQRFRAMISELNRKKIFLVNAFQIKSIFEYFSKLIPWQTFHNKFQVLLFKELVQEFARQADNPPVEWKNPSPLPSSWKEVDPEAQLLVQFRCTQLRQMSLKDFQTHVSNLNNEDQIQSFLFDAEEGVENEDEHDLEKWLGKTSFHSDSEEEEEEEEEEESEEEEEESEFDQSEISSESDEIFVGEDQEEDCEEGEGEEEILSGMDSFDSLCFFDDLDDESYWFLSSNETRNLFQKFISTLSLPFPEINSPQTESHSKLYLESWIAFSNFLKVVFLNPRTKYLLEEDFEAPHPFWKRIEESFVLFKNAPSELIELFSHIMQSFSILFDRMNVKDLEFVISTVFFSNWSERASEIFFKNQHFFEDYAIAKMWSASCRLVSIYAQKEEKKDLLVFQLKKLLAKELSLLSHKWLGSTLLLKYFWFGLQDIHRLMQHETTNDISLSISCFEETLGFQLQKFAFGVFPFNIFNSRVLKELNEIVLFYRPDNLHFQKDQVENWTQNIISILQRIQLHLLKDSETKEEEKEQEHKDEDDDEALTQNLIYLYHSFVCSLGVLFDVENERAKDFQILSILPDVRIPFTLKDISPFVSMVCASMHLFPLFSALYTKEFENYLTNLWDQLYGSKSQEEQKQLKQNEAFQSLVETFAHTNPSHVANSHILQLLVHKCKQIKNQ